MKIKDVMRLTGLTRKAIYYYEEAGLIAPSVDPVSQYRLYSPDDVERLRYIRLLRSLGMPIRDIHAVLERPDRTAELLRRRLEQTEAEAAELNERRSALLILIEAAEQSPEDGGRSRLGETDHYADMLERENRRRDDYMRRKLLELFPGMMGKFMALHFGAFLQEPLTGADKEAAWERLIGYIDSMEPIDIPPAMAGQIDRMSEEEVVEAAAAYRAALQRYIAPTAAEYEALKEETRLQAEQYKAWPDSRAQLAATRQLKERLVRAGFYEGFIGQMRVLSADYRSYLETLERLQRDAGIRFDDYGMLAI